MRLLIPDAGEVAPIIGPGGAVMFNDPFPEGPGPRGIAAFKAIDEEMGAAFFVSSTGPKSLTSPVAGPDGSVYLVKPYPWGVEREISTGSLQCWNADGSLRWEFSPLRIEAIWEFNHLWYGASTTPVVGKAQRVYWASELVSVRLLQQG